MQIFLEFFFQKYFQPYKKIKKMQVIINSKVLYDTTLVCNVIWQGIWQ